MTGNNDLFQKPKNVNFLAVNKDMKDVMMVINKPTNAKIRRRK